MNTGGPVHPIVGENRLYNNHTGMKLIDYFAGQALAGILANPGTAETGPELMGRIAEAAYEMARIMLKARMELTYDTGSSTEPSQPGPGA